MGGLCCDLAVRWCSAISGQSRTLRASAATGSKRQALLLARTCFHLQPSTYPPHPPTRSQQQQGVKLGAPDPPLAAVPPLALPSRARMTQPGQIRTLGLFLVSFLCPPVAVSAGVGRARFEL